MSDAPDPGRVLRRAVIAWGLGHLALGRRRVGVTLLAAELFAILLVGWLSLGLADTSLYLVPYLAGIGALATWAWQAVHAYRVARSLAAAGGAAAERSAATAIGWLSLPLLAWSAGFWLVAAGAATPAAVLDRFVTEWTAGELDDRAWPAAVIEEARATTSALGTGPDRMRDVRVSIVGEAGGRTLAAAEAIHFERHPTSFLWVFPGSALVPVADERVLELELVAIPTKLPGGVDLGAVRWEIVAASAR